MGKAACCSAVNHQPVQLGGADHAWKRAWNNEVCGAQPSIQYKYRAQPPHLPLSVPDQKQLHSRDSTEAKMKVFYVTAFLLGLLSLESTRAAPLKKQLWSVGSGSVNTGHVGGGSFNDNSVNNKFWAVESGSINTKDVGRGSFNDNSKNNQLWAVGSGSVNTGKVGGGSFNDNSKNNKFWSVGSVGGSFNGGVNNNNQGTNYGNSNSGNSNSGIGNFNSGR